MRITRTTPGSLDGIGTRLYREGEVHDLPVGDGELGRVFLDQGWAAEIADAVPPETGDNDAELESKAAPQPRLRRALVGRK